MSEGKYQTLDPLILETLNLNERRMNHILDILHGREPKEYPKTDRRPHKSISKNKTIATFTQDDSILPPITISNRKRKQKDDTKEPQKQANDYLGDKISARKSRTIEKTEKSQRSQPQQARSFKSPKQKPQRAQQQVINFEEEIMRLQSQRKEQVMKDYMMNKLKKSRSLQINPKDLYRIEIEHLVSELTPIEKIQQAERKMQRLKKRCRHLMTFDKSYYSKLCQNELINLS